MEIGVNLIKGIIFGIRHFDPEEHAPYFEIQLFIGIIQFYIIIHKK